MTTETSSPSLLPLNSLTPLEKLLRIVARNRFLPGSKSAYRKFCRRARGRRFLVKANSGVNYGLLANDSVANQIIVFGEFEPGVGALLNQLVPQEGTFVDLGCNLGYFTCLVGASHPRVKILAVDANPDMADNCRSNAALNQLQPAVRGVGVGAARTRLLLTFPANAPSHATFGQPDPGKKRQDLREVEAEVMPLRDLLEEEKIERIDVLKIDVEGFEDSVLSGIDDELANSIDSIVMEYCESNLLACGSSRTSVARYHWLQRFEVFSVDERSGELARHPSLLEVPANRDMVWLKRRDVAAGSTAAKLAAQVSGVAR